MVGLLTLDNLGINITALVAGLGVGGVAVALAVQNVLGDLFAALSITLDRPFVVGDFLAVGDVLGTVETIGIKSTRLRSLSGTARWLQSVPTEPRQPLPPRNVCSEAGK